MPFQLLRDVVFDLPVEYNPTAIRQIFQEIILNIEQRKTVLIPTGAVSAYIGTTAPEGWLICNGALVSRTFYADLFAVIGVTHGYGDQSTTFNLPDYRGKFLRGFDNGAGNDPNAGTRTAMATGGVTGDSIGSIQTDAFQGHYHNVTNSMLIDTGGSGLTAGGVAYGASSTNIVAPVTDGTNGTPRTSSESRPKNAGVLYIIKF
ncbi:MAG TPA: phage tail protein [Thermodesulfovibrionia bacterium]|nr:MAG: hypothetical protein A2Z57_10875 [Planctomycetes bacterium RIFCSPHIGHO2_12_39_6]HLA49787.1 phage tail protein [Thermodesulfovibrionia bacterium]